MIRPSSQLAARTPSRALALLFFVLALLGPTFAFAQTIPSNAKPTCTVTPAQFNGWFVSGHAALNGAVNPANSITFPNVPNCSFYQWSKQMFLWLTSPAPATYGSGNVRVMDSSVFYDVSPEVNGKRTLIAHAPGAIRHFSVRAAQVGVHGLPVVVDTQGHLIEFRRAAPTEMPVIKNLAGKMVPLASVSRDATNHLILMDQAGKTIQRAPAALTVQTPIQTQVPVKILPPTLFRVGGRPIIIDSTGNVIETEEGQAGGDGVLLAQNNSLVYYVTMVNDVYAYFETMSGPQTNTTTLQFPTTQATATAITTFAAAHGKTIPDASALAIEVKSSWIRADSLPNNAAGYITMQATVATYNTTNHQTWVPTGQQQNVTLALVGMHVVGSTAGHPEMVWATFEHFGNSPNAAYQYINASNVTTTIPQSTAGSWLFASNNAPGPTFNVLRAMVNAPDIIAVAVPPPNGVPASNAVVPTDVMRIMAWGSSFNVAPNPFASPAASNTDIISIHDSITSMLPAADIRSNYFMTGSTWTEGGANPTGTFPGGNQVGTSQLNNSTMETFQQNGTNTGTATNCMDCHTNINGGTKANVSISHIYLALQPLF